MILTILKFAGLFVAAASSIWGLTQELTFKTKDDRKRLTKAGKVSICFILFGLVSSIVSDHIGREYAAEDQKKKIEAEAKRTNEIIIATQPLTSLNFVLEFESSDSDFRKQMEDGNEKIQENDVSVQGGVPRAPHEAIEEIYSLIPMLKFLGQLGHYKQSGSTTFDEEDSESNGTIMLMPLDESHNTILSFARIYRKVEWYTNNPGDSSLNAKPIADLKTPYTTKKISANGNSRYSIHWDLDPLTLEHSADRSNSEIRSNAKLPETLKLAILDISTILPFNENNFALTGATNLWHKEKSAHSKSDLGNISNITLRVVVNGFSEFEYSYKLLKAYHKPLYYSFGDEIEVACTMFEFSLEK
ncbi:hypothetical protein D3C87_32620 [compost metagenome]